MKREIEELLHTVGKLLLDEGEAFRLAHPELLDAYQVAVEIRSEMKRTQCDTGSP